MAFFQFIMIMGKCWQIIIIILFEQGKNPKFAIKEACYQSTYIEFSVLLWPLKKPSLDTYIIFVYS